MKKIIVQITVAGGIVAVLTWACAGTPVFAQNYPDKPIRMVAPFAAGGGSDTTGRIIAQRLSTLIKQSGIDVE